MPPAAQTGAVPATVDSGLSSRTFTNLGFHPARRSAAFTSQSNSKSNGSSGISPRPGLGEAGVPCAAYVAPLSVLREKPHFASSREAQSSWNALRL